jgi:putative DNA primase/helicase
MRGDYFEFRPSFKLFIAGNHKPSLRSVDQAIRRRFHLVPFAVTIPPDQRDHDLGQKLRAEWGGILRWAIEGCVDWLDKGLDPPQAVRKATEAYLHAEDAFAEWMDESCEHDPSAWQGSSDLFASWKDWAERAGEFPGNQKRFTQQLEARGFIRVARRTARGFAGLKLRLARNGDTSDGTLD